MQTNLRILRARADAICAPPERTKRQQQTYDRILAVAPTLLAEASPDILTFANLARVLSISIGTLRNLFFDFDDLLGVVITTHLETLLEAVTAIPAATQGARRHRRAAYLQAAQSPAGAWLPAHTTMRRLRHTLPPDLAERAETLRRRIATALRPAAPSRPCAETAARIARVNARHPLPLRPPSTDPMDTDAFERAYLASGRALVSYAARVLAQPP